MYFFMARLVKAGHRLHLSLLAGTLGLLVTVGAGLFAYTQKLPFTTGLYWAIVTVATVGYGDVTPHNPVGRFIAVALMLTTIPVLGATFAVLTGVTVASSVRKVMQAEHHFAPGTYRLILGMHPTVPAIIHELVETKTPVVLVADIDPTLMPEAVHVVRGDPTDSRVIHKAKPAHAQHALVTAVSDADVLVSVVLLREQAPNVPIAALTHSGTVAKALQALGIDQVISIESLVAHTLAKSLETPHASQLIERLIDSDEHHLVEIAVVPAMIGQPMSTIRTARKGLVLGMVQNGTVRVGMANDPIIGSGDALMIIEPLSKR